MSESPTTFAEAEARLAEALPGYESRPQQQTLATAVENAVSTRTHLLGEAGTGTGKSLGYLIPSILSGQRVVISTATKALQDQIAGKDLPFLAEHLGVDFRYTILKGRSNYLCFNKAESLDPAEVRSLGEILRVANDRADDPGFTGERHELGFEISDADWFRVAADGDDCQAFGCSGEGLCWADRARKRATEVDVVVVNHALYLTDLRFQTLIGPHDVVVFDEAHEIEDYASNIFGTTLRRGGIMGACTEVRNFTTKHYGTEISSRASTIITSVLAETEKFWEILEEGRIRESDVLEHGDRYVDFANALIDLANFVANLTVRVMEKRPEKASEKLDRLKRRTANLAKEFQQIVTAPWNEMVRWVEKDRKDQWSLRNAPIDVGPILRRKLFHPDLSCRRCDGTGEYLDGECFRCEGSGQETAVTAVLVSATLSVNDRFDYIAGRLGIDSYDSLDVGTPFDYATQSALYIPKSLPDPAKERAAWSNMAINEMLDLVKASQGRALILFTSYTEMKNAYETISARVPYTCLMQGQKPNPVLAAEFAEDNHSLLFATRSFMTGVDFQGDTCSLVIINKLPFPVPTEPLNEARAESIQARGGNDFAEFTIPVMTLVLKQAFGRLIRHRNDRGVVAILDPRLETKGYGKGIVRSLPPATKLTEFTGVETYFGAVPA